MDGGGWRGGRGVITYNAKRVRLLLIYLPPYSSLSGKVVVALCKGAIVYTESEKPH